MKPKTDLLGQDLSPLELELVEIHERLTRTAERSDLSPCIDRGLRAALAISWQMLNDLNLDPPAPERIGGGGVA